MSVHTIYYKDGEKVKYLRPVLNREEYMALRNGGEQRAIVAAVRAGAEQQKSRLVQMCYGCLPNDDGTLKGSTRLSNTVGMDIDHVKPADMQPLRERILQKKDELGLRMLELSARALGYHLVFQRRPDLSHVENLEWASEVLGVEFDKGAKDITRVFFTTTGSAGDLLFLDDAIFEVSEAPCIQAQGDTQGTDSPCVTDPCVTFPTTYHGIPFETILKKYWEVTNNGFEPTEGDRDTLTFQLASDLRHICGKSFEWLDQVIPCYDGFPLEEKRAKIRNALASKYEGMPQRLRDTLNACQPRRGTQRTAPQCFADYAQTGQSPCAESPCELSRLFNSSRPPELPDTLPKLVKLVTQSTPKKYKATVAQAMFPPLGAYPKKLSFTYIDNQVRELRMNCLIVAETGSGKDSCTKQPLTHIIADMKARDKVNRERLKKFNDEYNSKAGNKQKPQRPDDLVIQNIKSDITKAALVQRTDEANGAPLYVRINELEQWDKIEGCSGRNNQFTTLKLCDDEGNDFGSDRASTQSVMGDGCLHLNWNANTTVPKLMRYFRYVLTDGPVSRLTLATVPDEEVGADIPVFGNYGSDYDEALKPYIDNLKAATGVIDCQQAKRLARRLKDECAEFACRSGDAVFDNLTHRALVMAFRKACLLYVANGMKWEKSIETFCRWSLLYDMYLKMTLFGDLIRNANDDAPTSKRGPRSLLEDLPDAFTLDDAKRVRQQQGLSNEGFQAIKMIRNWVNRKLVTQNSEFSFQKTRSA